MKTEELVSVYNKADDMYDHMLCYKGHYGKKESLMAELNNMQRESTIARIQSDVFDIRVQETDAYKSNNIEHLVELCRDIAIAEVSKMKDRELILEVFKNLSLSKESAFTTRIAAQALWQISTADAWAHGRWITPSRLDDIIFTDITCKVVSDEAETDIYNSI